MTQYVKSLIDDNDVRKGATYGAFDVDEQGFWIIDDVGDENFLFNGEAEIVSDMESESPNPFIKTVTETRLVSAYHDLPNGLELFVEPRKDEVKIDLESGTWNKQSLTELAQILSEIAEAM